MSVHNRQLSAKRNIGRSVSLLKAFQYEGSNPEQFGIIMAQDTVNRLSEYLDLSDKIVVDVGGGSGYVGELLRQVGASAYTVEYDENEMILGEHSFTGGVRGDGRYLPIRDSIVDVSYSSNVLEHVEGPALMLEEMARVLRPGGLLYLGFTNWLSPWGGHETSPYHYLGGSWSARRYERKYGRAPKNLFGLSLFKLHISDVLKWAKSAKSLDIQAVFPRYYPKWTNFVVKIPLIREVITWNLVIVLKKTSNV